MRVKHLFVAASICLAGCAPGDERLFGEWSGTNTTDGLAETITLEFNRHAFSYHSERRVTATGSPLSGCVISHDESGAYRTTGNSIIVNSAGHIFTWSGCADSSRNMILRGGSGGETGADIEWPLILSSNGLQLTTRATPLVPGNITYNKR